MTPFFNLSGKHNSPSDYFKENSYAMGARTVLVAWHSPKTDLHTAHKNIIIFI
jgi:hypothetical protein